MSFFRIHYCILLPDEDEFSPIQGFSPALLSRTGIVDTILRNAPPTVLELYHPSIQALQQRVAGAASYAVFPLIASDLNRLTLTPHLPFWVLFTDSETRSVVSQFIEHSHIPVLVVDSGDDRPNSRPPGLTHDMLIAHCDSVLALLQREHPDHPLSATMEKLRYNPDLSRSPGIEISFCNHNTTLPNELALLSVGCHYTRIGSPLVGDDEVYISAIVRSADELQQLRTAIPSTKLYTVSPPTTAMILTSPGIYRHVRGLRRPQHTESPEVFEVMRILQSQQTYSMQSDVKDFRRVMTNRVSQALLQLRTSELTASTAALAVRAASHLCPVLRLPPGVDHVLPSVIRLADAIRSRRRAGPEKKSSRLAQALFEDLRRRVDERFIERIDQCEGHIKILSDAPLEWLPVRGLPLMLRHSTSRIPATPGNLSFGEILPPGPIQLTMRDFQETLVVRSFRADDPLRNDLKTAIDVYRLSDGRELPVRIVDVNNRKQLLRALNGFEGALAIFDGHGFHSRSDDIGKLRLADEDVNLWEIRKEANMPPIFFACACDTHAINRSHVTSGNGLLACGSRAVIASVLPVESKRAAAFAGRLLFRIYELLPAIIGGNAPQAVRWDGVFSLLQRMTFVSELIFGIGILRGKRGKWGIKSQQKSTELIHTTGSDWYEPFVEALSQETGLSLNEIETYRQEHLPFPETLKYIHMGNPETIVVCPEDLRPEDYVD